jgi:hypothetical protein
MSAHGADRPASNVWKQLGYVLAVVIGIAGLAVLAAIILAVAMLSSFGSNK